MNFTYNTKSMNIIAIIVFTVAVFGSFVATVNAAPYGDYFTSTAQNGQNSFTAWFGQFNDPNTDQCDAYNAIFSTNCISDNGTMNFGSLAGVAAMIAQSSADSDTQGKASEESTTTTPSVTLLDQRCVNEDGVAEFSFDEVRSYELKRGIDVYAVSDLSDGENVDFETLSGLPDGNYSLTVFNNNGDSNASFTVDCDEDDGGGTDPDELNAACSVFPNNPNVNESVTWRVSANGGEGDYSYDWYGDVHGSTPNISVSYSSAGTKEGYATVSSGSDFETVRCTVEVEDEGGVIEQIQSRTIEEF